MASSPLVGSLGSSASAEPNLLGEAKHILQHVCGIGGIDIPRMTFKAKPLKAHHKKFAGTPQSRASGDRVARWAIVVARWRRSSSRASGDDRHALAAMTGAARAHRRQR
jgi:hypothetical protein